MKRKLAFSFSWMSLAVSALILSPICCQAALAHGAGQNSSSASAEPSPEGGTVTIGTVAGDPGTTVSIPLFYERAKAGTPLHKLQLELDFVSNSVKLGGAEKAPLPAAAEFDLKWELKELPPDQQANSSPDQKMVQHTRLRINVSVSDSNSGKALPEGLWAFFNFRIPPDAKPYSISVNPVAVSAESTSKNPLAVAAREGAIVVSIPDVPLVGCFFFTH